MQNFRNLPSLIIRFINLVFAIFTVGEPLCDQRILCQFAYLTRSSASTLRHYRLHQKKTRNAGTLRMIYGGLPECANGLYEQQLGSK